MDLVERIIRAVIGATHLPVTVKTRSGWNDEVRDPVGIARRMQDAGARAFTLHARTRTQMFSGKANWDEIARVVEALEIPVLGNGDVTSVADIAAMKAHTGCDGVMIGRGAIGNPWIFARLDREQVTPEQMRRMIERHLALNLDYYGPSRGLVLFRKYAAQYLRPVPGFTERRPQLMTAENPADFLQMVEELL
jgi:nifR3 family TIM-barrel protein